MLEVARASSLDFGPVEVTKQKPTQPIGRLAVDVVADALKDGDVHLGQRRDECVQRCDGTRVALPVNDQDGRVGRDAATGSERGRVESLRLSVHMMVEVIVDPGPGGMFREGCRERTCGLSVSRIGESEQSEELDLVGTRSWVPSRELVETLSPFGCETALLLLFVGADPTAPLQAGARQV